VSLDDLPQVLRVLNAFSEERYGTPEFSESVVRTEWSSGHLVPERDLRAAVDAEGQIVALIEFWDDLNGGVDDLQCYFHCMHGRVSTDTAERLIRFAEDRARNALKRADSSKEVKLSTDISLDNHEVQRLFTEAGYAPESYTTRMEIEFDSEPEAPVWPEAIVPRQFRSGIDDRAVHATRQEAWADMRHGHPIPFDTWRYFLIENNPHFDESLWAMAMDGDEIAGICLASAGMTEDPDRAWIYSVGVKRAYRKRGIATAMLRHAFCLLYQRGVSKAALSVDSESLTGAHRIYERVGMHSTRRNARYARILQP
jgi:ribosomal protein S18 acetylase RimI-like enzyme